MSDHEHYVEADRNRRAITYLRNCAFLRQEPNKYELMKILGGERNYEGPAIDDVSVMDEVVRRAMFTVDDAMSDRKNLPLATRMGVAVRAAIVTLMGNGIITINNFSEWAEPYVATLGDTATTGKAADDAAE